MSKSPRLSPLWLSASSSACHGLLIITVITHCRKAQRDKNARELGGGKRRTRQLLTCRYVSVMLLRIQNTRKELADAKAENDALRDDVAAGRRRLRIKTKSVSQCVKPPPPPAWIMQPPPRLADTAERDYFTLREG